MQKRSSCNLSVSPISKSKISMSKSFVSNGNSPAVTKKTSLVNKIDPRVYVDVHSKGITSRIVKYHDESVKPNRSVSAGNLYKRPGQFPIVHLNKNQILYKANRNRPVSVVKIAPPDKAVFQANTRSSILQSSSVVPSVSLRRINSDLSCENKPILHLPVESELVPTRSVLDALKEISRKRIINDELDGNDNAKRYCKDANDFNVAPLPVASTSAQLQTASNLFANKRQRDFQTSPNSKLAVDLEQSSKKRMYSCSNDITSSLSSSLYLLTPKRKFSDLKNCHRKLSDASTSIANNSTTNQSSPSSSETSNSPKAKQQRCYEQNDLQQKKPSNLKNQLSDISPLSSTYDSNERDSRSEDNQKINSACKVIESSPEPKKQQKLMLFNKQYDEKLLKEIEESKKVERYNENDEIGFVKAVPSNDSSKIDIFEKHPAIEKMKKARLALMLKYLQGDDDEDEDESNNDSTNSIGKDELDGASKNYGKDISKPNDIVSAPNSISTSAAISFATNTTASTSTISSTAVVVSPKSSTSSQTFTTSKISTVAAENNKVLSPPTSTVASTSATASCFGVSKQNDSETKETTETSTGTAQIKPNLIFNSSNQQQNLSTAPMPTSTVTLSPSSNSFQAGYFGLKTNSNFTTTTSSSSTLTTSPQEKSKNESLTSNKQEITLKDITKSQQGQGTALNSSGGFTFGTQNSNTISGINFGVEKSSEKSNDTRFMFGAEKKVQNSNTTATGELSTGVGNNLEKSNTTTAYTFGTENSQQKDTTFSVAPAKAFTFGGETNSQKSNILSIAPASGGFSFGNNLQKTNSKPKENPSDANKPTGLFNFGSSVSTASSTGGFSFKNSNTAQFSFTTSSENKTNLPTPSTFTFETKSKEADNKQFSFNPPAITQSQPATNIAPTASIFSFGNKPVGETKTTGFSFGNSNITTTATTTASNTFSFSKPSVEGNQNSAFLSKSNLSGGFIFGQSNPDNKSNTFGSVKSGEPSTNQFSFSNSSSDKKVQGDTKPLTESIFSLNSRKTNSENPAFAGNSGTTFGGSANITFGSSGNSTFGQTAKSFNFNNSNSTPQNLFSGASSTTQSTGSTTSIFGASSSLDKSKTFAFGGNTNSNQTTTATPFAFNLPSTATTTGSGNPFDANANKPPAFNFTSQQNPNTNIRNTFNPSPNMFLGPPGDRPASDRPFRKATRRLNK